MDEIYNKSDKIISVMEEFLENGYAEKIATGYKGYAQYSDVIQSWIYDVSESRLYLIARTRTVPAQLFYDDEFGDYWIASDMIPRKVVLLNSFN